MLFLVILALGSLLAVDHVDRGWVLLEGMSSSFAVFASFAALMLITLKLAEFRARDRLDSPAVSVAALQGLYSRCQRAMVGLAAGAHFSLLFATRWPEYVQSLVGGQRAGLDELVMLLPFVALLTMGYVRLYPIDRALREAMVGDMLLVFEPIRPIWRCGQYVSFQLRFHLFLVAVPLMLIVAAKDVIDANRSWFTHVAGSVLARFDLAGFAPLAGEGALAVAAGAVVLLSPFLVRAIWRCRSLPAGTLRTQLEALAAGTRLRYRNILLWPSHGVIANAAVAGLFGRVRYIMLSDGLIESMTDGQIEGVFGHEIGHVKHHHLPLLLMFAFGSMGIVFLTSWHVQLAWQWPQYVVEPIVFLAVFAIWLGLFGRVSRAFERQADLFAVESLSERFDRTSAGCGTVGCRRHAAESAASGAAEHGRPLCLAAAELAGSSLLRAAALNAIPQTAHTWRHGSILHRRQHAVELATDPAALARFRANMTYLKLAIIGSVVLAVVGALLSLNTLQDQMTGIRPW